MNEGCAVISVMRFLISLADMFMTFIDRAPGIICIYLYDIVYVLSCARCNGVIYVYPGNMTYMVALCVTYVRVYMLYFPA